MYPRKCFIGDLIGSSETSVWISGKIEETIGAEVILVNDGTGRAKAVDCDSAYIRDGPEPPAKGSRCSVIGMLIRNDGSPEIRAEKIITVEDSHTLRDLWTNEVKELQLFLDGKMEPNIAT